MEIRPCSRLAILQYNSVEIMCSSSGYLTSPITTVDFPLPLRPHITTWTVQYSIAQYTAAATTFCLGGMVRLSPATTTRLSSW